jgi:hypothetical protein
LRSSGSPQVTLSASRACPEALTGWLNVSMRLRATSPGPRSPDRLSVRSATAQHCPGVAAGQSGGAGGVAQSPAA